MSVDNLIAMNTNNVTNNTLTATTNNSKARFEDQLVENNKTHNADHATEYRTAISCFIIFGFLLWFSVEIGWKLCQGK